MIAYKNLDDICEGVSVYHLLNDEGRAKLKKCIKVYWVAYYDPPEGVAGVGRITYAEQQLVLAQEGVA
jgi:hypothetical protein